MSPVVPSARWLDVVGVRRARRSFDASPVSSPDLDALERACEDFRPFGDLARAVLVREAPQSLFMGVAGSYGGISGSPSALAFIGLAVGERTPAAVGYTGEGLVLESTSLGLETCWVGGLFSSRHAASLGGVQAGERVCAVSALGHAHKKITPKERVLFRMARAKYRSSAEEIAPGSAKWPEWARAGLEAVRIAPSAMNRQPWRFRMTNDGTVVVSAEGVDTPRISKRLDCGIAMLHFELGARGAGADGSWELLDGADVGCWSPG